MASRDQFLDFAKNRQQIYLNRLAGLPRSEWTKDVILRDYRFTNVFRENDKTTVWFRENVRDPLKDKPEVLLATVLFRWFNRIETGEAIFTQQMLNVTKNTNVPCLTSWETYQSVLDTHVLRLAIKAYCGKGPYVTGAYIIKTPDGMNKLDGVLWCVDAFMNIDFAGNEGLKWTWKDWAQFYIDMNTTGQLRLADVWNLLRKYPYLGDFMAYEIVTDLRHTALLNNAPDILTWANPGPGAMRGMNRLLGIPLNKKLRKDEYIAHMRILRDWFSSNWPWADQIIEMREIEHTLCEFDKYMRVKLGEGTPKQRFR